ncbi:hypothetical protein OAS86_03990 [Gammaproteobacteria bacterium]|nr:hypothetical protein [Gammaproteobacteria bacterium]
MTFPVDAIALINATVMRLDRKALRFAPARWQVASIDRKRVNFEIHQTHFQKSEETHP